MQIRYQKETGVGLFFTMNEIQIALLILKAVYKSNPEHFIGQAINDIEADMRPKLPAINYHHICHKCFRDLDERNPDSIHIIIDGDERWVHRECIPLKDNRPE